MDLLGFGVLSWRICMGWACLEYVYALSIAGILVSRLPLVFCLTSVQSLCLPSCLLLSNTVNFLEQ